MPVVKGERGARPAAALAPPPSADPAVNPNAAGPIAPTRSAPAVAPQRSPGAVKTAVEPRAPAVAPAPAAPPAPTGPPVPVLQQHGYHGSIQDFNTRVQSVHDSYQAAYGVPPSPGLTFDLAKSPVDAAQFNKLFTVPLAQRAAKARGAINAQGFAIPPPVMDAKQLASGIVEAAAHGDYHQYLTVHADVIHDLSSQHKNDAAVIAGAVFKARRLRAFRDVEEKINTGDLSPFEGHQQLQAMGFIPGGVNTHMSRVGGFIALGIGQIVGGLIHSPGAVIELGKAVGLDTRDIVVHPMSSQHFKRTAPIGKGLATSLVRDVTHPAENPGNLFMDALGFASVGASGVARIGAAGRVLGEGGGALAATRQLAKKPPLTRVALRHGDLVEEMPLVDNPLVAQAQKLIVRYRQKGADARLAGDAPTGLQSILIGPRAQEFLDKQLSFETKIGRETDIRKRTDHTVNTFLSRELDHVAGKAVTQARIHAAVPAKVRGALTRGEQKAIFAQSWDVPGDAFAKVQAERDFHQRMIDAGIGDEKAHRTQLTDLKLAEAALRKPSPRFQKALELTQRVVADMERIKIEDLGLLPETAEGRIAKAGAVLRGEPLERTVAVPQPDLLPKPAGAGFVYHGSPEGVVGEIDPFHHTQPWKEGVGHYVTESPEAAAMYARGRTARGERAAAARETGVINTSKIKPDAKILNMDAPADLSFWRNIAKGHDFSDKDFDFYILRQAGKNPTNAKIRTELLDQLRETHGTDAPYAIEDAYDAAGVQATTHMEGVKAGKPHRVWVVRDPKVLERHPDKAIPLTSLKQPDKLETQPLERVNPESFYLPTQRRGKVKRPPSDRQGFYSSKLGPYGLSPGREMPELTHSFEGKAIQAGDTRIDATSLATEAYGRTVRAATIKEDHAKHWDAASLTPYGRHSIPIRDSNVISDQLREVMARLDEGDFGPKDAEMLPSDARQLLEHLYPDPKKPLTEEQLKDVRWLDARVLGQGVKAPHVPGLAADVANFVNAPLRFLTLHARPGYILNKPGNHAMGLLDQGWMWPGNFAKAMNAESRYGEEAARAIREHVGAGKTRSYSTEAAGRFSQAVTEFWNRVADRDERVASFIYYAERKGYKTREEMDRLLNDPKARQDLIEVKRRGNNALVGFDNLLPIEKNYLRHIIFVYPWVSRSAVWSIRTALEHPAKVDMLAHLGNLEKENDPIFGHAAEWMKRTGYIPLGFNGDGTVRVVNPTSVNSFSTLGDFIAVGRAVVQGDKYASASDFLGPAPKFLIHAVTGRDDQGNAYPGSQWAGAAMETLGLLPQIAAYQKASKYKPGDAKPVNVADRASLETSLNAALRQTVLSPGWLDGYGSLLVGGFSPRNLNLNASAARYWQDQDPKVRHERELDLLNRALNVQADVLQRPVSRSVRAAVRNLAEIDYGYKQFLKETGRKPTDKERANYTITYLTKQGLMPKGAAATWRQKLAPLQDTSDISRLKGHLLDKYANGVALRDWDTSIRTVASFSKPVFNQKAAELFAQGLSPQRSYAASQNTLYDYGRKYLAFTEQVKKMHADGATDAQLRAFQDENDRPVNGLPSFTRMAWINQPPEARQAQLQHSTVQSWSTLTAFDKALLGRPSDAKVTAGWAKLKEFEATQRAEAKRQGRGYPAAYTRTLAQYVERHFDAPGLVKDYDFSKQPLYQRMKFLSPVQNSPNKALWGQLFSLADHQYKALKSGDYSSGQLTQQWTDYVTDPDFQAWIGEHPGFKAEIQGFGKQTLVKLIGG